MLKYIDGTAVATNNSGKLFWEGYFTEEISEVIKKIQSDDLGSIRGQYSFLYLDKTVKHGVSYNLGYPLYTNGVDYSNDPLDLQAKINYEKLIDLLSCIALNNTTPFDPKYYDCFDNCRLLQTTEILIPSSYGIEKLKEDFLSTVEVNTRNKSIAIMFGDGWESHAMLNACKILGRDFTLVNIKSKTPTHAQSLGNTILLDNTFKDFYDISFHNTRHFNKQHMNMTSVPLDFDVILRGNDAEIFQGCSELWTLGFKDASSVITTSTTRNSIFELNTLNTWIDPFTNLDHFASLIAGNLQVKNRIIQKNLTENHDTVCSDNGKTDWLSPETNSKIIFENIKLFKDLELSNGLVKALSKMESGLWGKTFRSTLNRYV